MVVWLLLALVIAVFSGVFALQNAVPVTVAFLKWRFQGSLALVLLLSLSSGALAAFLALVPALLRGKWRASSLQKRLEAAEQGLNKKDPTTE
ncbi:MAG: DUF1049 domain-containing protein [Elusimicrobia bacterium]|nr:DUF1049 domain-containing protein [Elusimicrobiota bacterium]